MGGCKNNPEKLSALNVGEHILWDFSMSTISSFKHTENKHGIYRVKYFMKCFVDPQVSPQWRQLIY